MLRKSISQLVVLVLACWVGLRTHRSWTDAMIEDDTDLVKSNYKTKGSYRGVWENSVKMSALGRGENFEKVITGTVERGGAKCDTTEDCGAGASCASSKCVCVAAVTDPTDPYTGRDCRLLKTDLGEVDASSGKVYEYDQAKWEDLVTLDFAWLSGAYLLLAIILVGIATIGDFTNFKGFEQIMAAASNLVSVTVQKSIVTAISTSIFDVLAVVLLAGSMLTFENLSASGSTAASGRVALLSTELIFSLAALTVISRSTRALAASAMSFTVTIFASMCIVIIVVDQWRQLPMITRMISRPQLLLLCSFEFIYVLSRLAAVQSDAALITLKALGVNMVLYITARMHANLRPLTPSANVAGSTRDQLSPLDEQCNFLHDDMVVYDADSRVSEKWYSFSVNACTGGGDYQNWPMLVPILLLVAYCVLVYLDDMKVISTALNKFQTLYLPTGQTESYRRIRVI